MGLLVGLLRRLLSGAMSPSLISSARDINFRSIRTGLRFLRATSTRNCRQNDAYEVEEDHGQHHQPHVHRIDRWGDGCSEDGDAEDGEAPTAQERLRVHET